MQTVSGNGKLPLRLSCYCWIFYARRLTERPLWGSLRLHLEEVEIRKGNKGAVKPRATGFREGGSHMPRDLESGDFTCERKWLIQ